GCVAVDGVAVVETAVVGEAGTRVERVFRAFRSPSLVCVQWNLLASGSYPASRWATVAATQFGDEGRAAAAPAQSTAVHNPMARSRVCRSSAGRRGRNGRA